MATNGKRIYVVTETSEKDDIDRMVRASSQAAAIRHVVVGRFEAAPASPDDVVRLMGAGITVSEAGEE